MSVGRILTLGYGSFGGVHFVPTMGFGTGATPPPAVVTSAGGSIRFDQRIPKKKKKRVLTYAEFANQEERAEAMARALAEESIALSAVREDGTVEDDELEDDEILLMAVLRIIH